VKWIIIGGVVLVAGYFGYQFAKPYLTAVKNIGGVAGDVRGTTRAISSAATDISHIFKDVSNITSGVSDLWDTVD
jgi:hypothetical protein